VTTPARTVFLGSGAFAIPTLAMLLEHPEVELVAVVTAPPRPAGRGNAVRPSPVGTLALERGIEVMTPHRLRAPDAVETVLRHRPQLVVLADYGQIVPPALLDAPHGALNVHPSLLPRHRGASPVPAAILAGDGETGVTVMRMDAGLDTGPIVAQERVALTGSETAPELEAELAARGAVLLGATLPGWLASTIEPRAQDPAAATMTRPLRREDGRLDPARPAVELEREVRALQPWPGAFVETAVGRLLVRAASVAPDPGPAASPGSLVAVPGPDGARGLGLSTSEGLLELRTVQPAGGRAMSGAELLRGRPSLAGSRLRAADVR
jgi:methionyl-tRNA formyltransferase